MEPDSHSAPAYDVTRQYLADAFTGARRSASDARTAGISNRPQNCCQRVEWVGASPKCFWRRLMTRTTARRRKPRSANFFAINFRAGNSQHNTHSVASRDVRLRSCSARPLCHVATLAKADVRRRYGPQTDPLVIHESHRPSKWTSDHPCVRDSVDARLNAWPADDLGRHTSSCGNDPPSYDARNAAVANRHGYCFAQPRGSPMTMRTLTFPSPSLDDFARQS